ncbi:MAG: acetyltransferase [Caloramator sp.]|nr:acetyltransferase [Caloramator sp.]
MNSLLILGAGGHGKVVLEAAESKKRWESISFLDDNLKDTVLGYPVLGRIDEYEKFITEYNFAFAAIGNNKLRLELIEKLKTAGYNIPTITHPSSYVSRYATIGEGTIILSSAVINTGSVIGKGCIININSCIDHDCNIGDGTHICSGAVVRSMVSIGRLCYIGAGAVVKSSSRIEDGIRVEDGERWG